MAESLALKERGKRVPFTKKSHAQMNEHDPDNIVKQIIYNSDSSVYELLRVPVQI